MSSTVRVLAAWLVLGTTGIGYLHLQAGTATGGTFPGIGASFVQQQTGASSPQPSSDRTLLAKYCVSCHSDRLRTAGLSLQAADPARIEGHEEVWEKVAGKLRTGAMPPAGLPRPDKAVSAAFVASLESALDAASAKSPNPGRRLPLHRLNRAEYANAVRDLLAVEIDVRSLLPVDDANHGFDSIASVLTVSPVLLERYMSAARRISRLAVGDPAIGPALAAKTYELPPSLFQDGRMSEDLPFGSRGGIAVRHSFPLDGEYVIKIRLQKNYVDYVRGLGEEHRLDVRVDGRRIESFTVGRPQDGTQAPISYAGNISGAPDWEAYALSADENLEVRTTIQAGIRVVGVAFVARPGEPEGVLQPSQTGYAYAVDESRSSPSGLEGPAVHSVAIDGPYNASGAADTASRRRIFVCRPAAARDEKSCAKTILQTLARRAYRRTATADDVNTLMTFFEEGRQGGGFDAGVQRALERMLVDPDFLFRIERDPPKIGREAAYRISDVELASRLSFFLWSSIPDDELLDLAERGKLGDRAVLARQVRRMLADSRSKALVDNFAGQWLSLRGLQNAAPNPDLFPDFDENLRQAFRRETELFVESQLREDRSVVDLLTADYTFVNERLARHYGIPNVFGNHFRRVKVPQDTRGGLLAHGSILTVTSYGNRTSPVLRGHWLLENILGSPPPPPPADVPGLAERGADGQPTSVRARLELHRKNPACATCHLPMDPLGFALENYDAVGGWRTKDETGKHVDASGVMPDGTEFVGLTGLRTHLLGRREQFVRTMTEKILTYALGRGVEYYDRAAIRKVTRGAAANEYRWSDIILGVVTSAPFQMRRSAS
jgi:mono/diheme cytochrome c family protein